MLKRIVSLNASSKGGVKKDLAVEKSSWLPLRIWTVVERKRFQ